MIQFEEKTATNLKFESHYQNLVLIIAKMIENRFPKRYQNFHIILKQSWEMGNHPDYPLS